ncbi:hypothetical protein PR202_gb17366 [Eleusine coracana subsp. coracana]|uniref:Uncharacterized protein n=1 Tax=Eleusine coracana subsp. coracana TaxID=191504 RepID=A0AAV5F0F8_ELECO|nr:hypothetical protein QOZ80_6BG0467070 [Eleusine coracana subsp. coracana]GJN29169.1 hypothetical protein PR202_gb17366 [Eleusine coracana subsp. coracana]
MLENRLAAALSRPCVLIIVVASVERFAYKGVSSNLVTYLTGVVGMSPAAAAKSVSAWSGVNFMLPLFSAILADSYWDRYSTITGSSFIYVLGMVGLTTWALLRTWMPCSTLFLPLYLISIGQAGYNPSLQAFGADQLDIGDDDDSGMDVEEKGKMKSKFFQWWYFGICTGSLMGNSILPYIQDNFGWGLGFAIPCGIMALSVVAFLCCTPLYTQKQPESTETSTRTSIIKVLKSILGNVGSRKISLPSKEDNANTGSELEMQGKPLKDEPPNNPTESADEAAPSVAKVILGLLPIWTMMLMFAVIFQQPLTFFTEQGMLMNHSVGGVFVIPPAMLQSSINISIILLVPMYDKVIIPFVNTITRRSNGISVLQRIGVGMVLSILAMVIAALVEARRLRVQAATSGSVRMSIFWLLPQYVLLGVSDVFTVVGMQEFFYAQVPSNMKTIGIGLNTSVFGFGSFLGAFLIAAIEMATGKASNGRGWFADDPREAHLDKYYWFLAFLCSVSFIMFTHLCKYYNGKDASAK